MWEGRERKNILFPTFLFKSQSGSLSSRRRHDARSTFYCHDKKNNFEPIRAADKTSVSAPCTAYTSVTCAQTWLHTRTHTMRHMVRDLLGHRWATAHKGAGLLCWTQWDSVCAHDHNSHTHTHSHTSNHICTSGEISRRPDALCP